MPQDKLEHSPEQLFSLTFSGGQKTRLRLSLVINDEVLKSISPQEWRRREITRIFKEHRREQLKAANRSHKALHNEMAAIRAESI
jgi:hypothetical protein